MIPFIGEYIREKFNIDPIFILLESRQIRQAELSTISFLVKKKEKDREDPFAIIKMPRYADNIQALRTLELENENLTILSKKLSQELLSSVPSILFFDKISDAYVLGERFIAGLEMSSAILKGPSILDNFAANSIAASSWLSEFEDSFEKRPTGSHQITESLSNDLSSKLSQTNYRLLNKALKILSAEPDRQMAIVPQHGDFHASNIFMKNGKIAGVIDWEDFSLVSHPPCYDLVHFIYTYIEALYEAALRSGSLELTKDLQSSKALQDIAGALFIDRCAGSGNDSSTQACFILFYLLRSLAMASDPRKMAQAAASKLLITISFAPCTFAELFSCMAYKNYFLLGSKYRREGNEQLAKLCEERIKEIKDSGSARVL